MAGSNPGNTAYAQTYTVHTGTDIYAVFNDTVITTSQGISYSITRQKAPVYTLGSVDPRSVARSKRGIAGSMIMTTFDRHCLGSFMQDSTFAAKRASLEATDANPHHAGGANTPTTSDVASGLSGASAAETATGSALESNQATPSVGISNLARPMFTDQLLPYDTTLAARNEYEQGSSMRVFGMEILNEGSGISIDDTSNEVQLTYIARLLTPWISENG